MEYVDTINQVLNAVFGEYAQYAGYALVVIILYVKNFMKTPEQGTLKYKVYRIIVDLPTGTWTKHAKDTGEKTIKVTSKK